MNTKGQTVPIDETQPKNAELPVYNQMTKMDVDTEDDSLVIVVFD